MSQHESSTLEATENENGPVAWWHLHRRLYDWVLHWAQTPYGGWALFVLSFAESSFFPVPPDVLLAPLTLGNRKKWLKFALICSGASVVGGIFGYMIGVFLWASVGSFFHNNVPGFDRDSIVLTDGRELEGFVDKHDVKVTIPAMHPELEYPAEFTTTDKEKVKLTETNVNEVHIKPFSKVGSLYISHDWKVVAVAGFTPLPYKVITITAGIFEINFLIFIIASTISRSARFFLVAGLFGKYGPWIKPYIDKYFNLLCLLFLILLVGGVVLIKYI